MRMMFRKVLLEDALKRREEPDKENLFQINGSPPEILRAAPGNIGEDALPMPILQNVINGVSRRVVLALNEA